MQHKYKLIGDNNSLSLSLSFSLLHVYCVFMFTVCVCSLHREDQERSKVTSAQSVQQHQTELIKVCKCPPRH